VKGWHSDIRKTKTNLPTNEPIRLSECRDVWCRLAKFSGNPNYRFPDYMYRVWGNDFTDLSVEHWGYLAVCVTVIAFTLNFVSTQKAPYPVGFGFF
jgi:hypothetical protein